MRKTKKAAALLMATVLMGSLAGCKSNVNEGDEVSSSEKDPVTLTVYSQLANFSGIQTGWFGQIMKEKFNVDLNIVPDADGVYDTRMESGNLGDIVVWGGDGDEYQQAVKAGLLFDWNEDNLVSEYGPYIKEHMSSALEKNALISDGTCYGFGHAVAVSDDEHQDFFYTWDIRWDLYKQLGYPSIKDYDELVAVLKRMKEICPKDDNENETYAVSLWPDWDGDMVMYVKSMVTAYHGYDEQGMGLYNVENGELYDALDKNGPYIEALRFFNQLYQNDLLDPDSMTQTYTEAVEKVQNGGTFFSIFNYAGSDAYNTDTHMTEGKMMKTLLPENATPLVYAMSVQGGNRIWSIGAKTEYPELCMEIINWLCTPEGRMVSEYGPQGVIWDYDENKNTYLTDLGKACLKDQKTQMPEGWPGTFEDGRQQINNITWALDTENPDSNGETYNYKKWKSERTAAQYEIEQDWRDFTKFDDIQDYLNSKSYKTALGTSYAIGTRADELQVVWNQVKTCITTNSWKAMYAKTDAEFEKVIDEMISQAQEYGYDQCVEWTLQEAAKRKQLEDEVR